MKELNYEQNFPFVAVEFDTFANVDWDPPYHHVGVLVNQIGSSSTTQWFNTIGQVQRGIYDANISYNSSSKKLSVSFTGYKDNVTINQNSSMVINLREILPDWVEFGFSSATGTYYEEHTLISWSFNSSLDLETDQGFDFPSTEQTHKGGNNTRLVIGLSVGLGAGVIIVMLGIACLVRWMLRNRGMEDVSLFDHAMDCDFQRISLPKKFSYEELATATSNFARENKIGQGGFGAVYRGFIRELNTYVAIKKVSRGSRQGVKEYASEVNIISQLRHKNLVQLLVVP